MASESTRRDFIRIGGAAAAGLAVGTSSQSQEHTSHANHEHHAPPAASEFSRKQPSPGGPVGSATDRGKLVSGYRSPADPPASVVMPDLQKLPWEMKDGIKEFHLTAQHVRREILPDQMFDLWGYNGSTPGP